MNMKSSWEPVVMYLATLIKKKPRFNLGLATGFTPLQFYFAFARHVAQTHFSLEKLFCFHLDEYAGMPQENPPSFAFYIRQHVMAPWGLKDSQALLWKGD